MNKVFIAHYYVTVTECEHLSMQSIEHSPLPMISFEIDSKQNAFNLRFGFSMATDGRSHAFGSVSNVNGGNGIPPVMGAPLRFE